MKRAWLGTLVAASIWLSTGAASAQAPAAGPDGNVELAQEWASKAKSRFEAGDYQGAIDAMTEAQKHVRPPTFVRFLARAHEKLGKLMEAERLYRAAIEIQLAADAPPAMRAAQEEAKRDLESITARIPTLHLEVAGKLAGLKIIMDGSLLDSSLLGRPLPLDPGKHSLVVEASGHEKFVREVELSEGAKERVTAQLKPAAPALGARALGVRPELAAKNPEKGPGERPASSKAIGGYAALGVGGLGLIVGAITGGLAITKRDEARAQCGAHDFDAGRCRSDLIGALTDARSFAQIATPALIVAGVGAATGATLLVLDRKKAPGVGVAISPGLLSVRGAF